MMALISTDGDPRRSFVSCLNRFDFLTDVFGGLGGFFCQFLHLVRDDGKPFARFSCTRRFDRGVERKKIRLLRNGRDDLDDVADFNA